MEFVYWVMAAAVLGSIGVNYWIVRRAISAIPKVEERREIHLHREVKGDFAHPKCDYCHCIVARYKLDSDSKVICVNCARERNM